MDIAEQIEAALGEVILLYGRTPEFGESEPDEYAVYNITEIPREFAEGVYHSTEYLCRLAVFTTVLDFPLYRKIKRAMTAAGFGYVSGGQTGSDGLFPYITHYYLDFLGVCDEDE